MRLNANGVPFAYQHKAIIPGMMMHMPLAGSPRQFINKPKAKKRRPGVVYL